MDEFDDDVEPPSGPDGPLTYSILVGSFSINAESGGVLNMNSDDAGMLGDDELAISISPLSSTYSFTPGSGGFVEAKFSFPGGIVNNSFLDLDIASQPWEPSNPNEAVELSIGMDTPGVISASFVAYVDDGLTEVEIDIDEIDITGLLATTTNLTVRLDISTANIVTASLDIGSDGTFDLIMSGSYTLTFPGGKPYTCSFGPGMDVTACTLNTDLSFVGDTLNMGFYLGTQEPATWNVYLSVFDVLVPLFSIPLPALDQPISVPISIPGFPDLGGIGVLTTLTTADGIICSDWETVDTGQWYRMII